MSTLILYSSCDGQTLKISQRLLSHFDDPNAITLFDLNDSENWPAPNDFQQVIIGASIRYGKLRPAVYQYISKYQNILNDKSNAFFLVCLTARKPEKCNTETNVYFQKFLKLSQWKPQQTAIFAGALQYSRYNWWQTRIIQLIMKITGGSTDTDKDIEFTDWCKVDEFAQVLKQQNSL